MDVQIGETNKHERQRGGGGCGCAGRSRKRNFPSASLLSTRISLRCAFYWRHHRRSGAHSPSIQKAGPQHLTEGGKPPQSDGPAGRCGFFFFSCTERLFFLFLAHWRGRRDNQTWCPHSDGIFHRPMEWFRNFARLFFFNWGVVHFYFPPPLVYYYFKDYSCRVIKTAFIASGVLHNREAFSCPGCWTERSEDRNGDEPRGIRNLA